MYNNSKKHIVALSMLLAVMTLFPPQIQAQPSDLVYLDEIQKAITDLYYSPTFDIGKWNQTVADTRKSVQSAKASDVDVIFSKLLSTLGSNHTYYIPAQVVGQMHNDSLSYGGIGLSYRTSDSEFYIDEIFPGGPAERAGLKSGDRILSVDGKGLEDLIIGEPGTPVTLQILDTAGAKKDVTLIREKIFVYSDDIEYRRYGNFGYIRIFSFTEELPKRFDLALARLGPLDGLVLDLRGNGGGLISACSHVAARLGADTIGRTVSKENGKNTEEKNSSTMSQIVKGPVAVLVDEGSASSSEILAQTIKDKNLGKVLGKPTAAAVQTGVEVPLSNGGYIMVTVGLTFSPSGFDFTKPVTPNEVLPDTDHNLYYSTGRDTQIERALAVLGELTVRKSD